MKTGLAPLVVCATLLISSVSAGGYKTGVTKTSADLKDTGDSYLNAYDPNEKNSYDFKYVNNDADTSERDGTLGDSVVAGTATDATESPDVVTLSPELKKEAGIENGAISTDMSSNEETAIKQGIIGGTDSSGTPTTETSQTTPATKGGTQWTPAPASNEDTKATKGGLESTPAPQTTTNIPQSTPASTPTSDDDQSGGEVESTDASESTDTPESTDAPQSTPAATQTTDTSQSNNQWTPAPNQSNNQQPTQAPNNEAPQPTQPSQPPHSEPPQPTQPGQPPHSEPPQPTQPGQNSYWQSPATNSSQTTNWQGSWDSATQTQTTPAPTTTTDSSQESNRDSPVPTEPTYSSETATTPAPPSVELQGSSRETLKGLICRQEALLLDLLR